MEERYWPRGLGAFSVGGVVVADVIGYEILTEGGVVIKAAQERITGYDSKLLADMGITT